MASGTPLGQMYIELGLDVSSFTPSLNGAKNAVRYFQNNVRSLDNVLKTNGKNADLLKSKYNTLGQAIAAQKKVLEQMKANFDKLDPGTARFDKAAADIERENAKLAAMEGQLRQVEKALQAVGKENSWSGKLDKLGDTFIRGGEKLRSMGEAMKPVSAALTAGFVLSTKKAVDFESQMNTTRSLLADTVPTVKDLDRVTAQAGESSKKWAKQYGITTSSVNEGMQELIKAGYTWEQTQAAMPAILDASKASGEDFNTVMNATSSIIAQYGLRAKDAGRVTDSLTYVANKTKAGFSDMGNAMEYVGPVSHSLGMSLEETAAAIGLLSNAGIQGEKAGTGLRGALSKLLKPSSQNAQAMKELGFSVEEFQSGALKLPDILDRIKTSTKGMTDAEKSALITKAFGVEAQTTMNILTNEGGDALRNLTRETQNAKHYTKGLADELSKSSKNGVERFKSSLEVLQINIGQKLLPMLTPVIEKVNDFINWLDQLPPSLQNAAVGFGLVLAAGYPILNFLGNASSGIGLFLKGASKLAGTLSSGLGFAKAGKAAGELATGVAGAAGKTSLLTKAVGAMTSPLGLAVGATALLAGGVIYLANQKDKARAKAEEFGTALSETARRDLRAFQSKVDDTTNAMANFGTHAGDAQKVSGAFKALYEEVAKAAERSNQRIQALADKWGLTPEQVERARAHNNEIVANTETMMKQINEIYNRHNGDASKFSQEEKEIILNNQKEMVRAKLELMDLSAKEQKAVLTALNGDIKALNETQLKHTKESLEKALKEENTAYKQSKADLRELLEAKAITKKEYNAKLEQLESEHNQTMEGLGTKYLEVMQSLDSKIKTRTGQNWNYWEEAKKKLEEYGLSYEGISQKAREASRNMGESHSILARYTQNMTKETKEANDAWSLLVGTVNKNNQFVVKSNAKEVIGEAVKSAEGWEQLKLIAKNADINSNARATMAEALVESGKWASMTLEEKNLIVHNQEGLRAIFDSEDHLRIWNGMTPELKQLLLDNQDVMTKASLAKATLENFDQLTPKAKELLARDEVFRNAVSRSTETLSTWNASEVFPKDFKGNAADILEKGTLSLNKLAEWNNAQSPTKVLTADSSNATSQGQAAINKQNEWNNTASPTKPVTADASNATSQGQAAIDKQNQWNNTPSPTKQILADNSNALSNQGAAINKQNEWNNTGSPTKPVRARDEASDVLSNVLNWFNSIPIKKYIDIVARKVGLEKGTNYHTGGLAVVNDQKGSVYRELIQLPTGERFIPEGRDVVIPLPRGSKVFPAYKTRRLMKQMGIPKYANGVGIPNDAKFIREMEESQPKLKVTDNKVEMKLELAPVVAEIQVLKESLGGLLEALLEKPLEVALDGEVIAKSTTKRQAKILRREGI